MKQCVDKCWSSHNYGQDIYNEDCYVIDVKISEDVTKSSLEAGLEEKSVNIYFELLEKDTNYKLKIRYNASAPEISLLDY